MRRSAGVHRAPDSTVAVSNQASEDSAARDALARVLAGQTFAGSARLSTFLRFVCEETWEGRSDQLNEGHIARIVFGRPEHFNSGEDSIVRSSARLLRQRLDRYYEGEGAADPLKIALPRGSYLPVFAPRDSLSAAHAVAAPDAVGGDEGALATHTLPAFHAKKRRLLLAGSALALSVVGAGAVWLPARRERSPLSRVWELLLTGPRRLLIVPADSGLVMWQGTQARQLSLEEYSSLVRPSTATPGAMAGAISLGDVLQGQRYTGVVSVRLAVELTRLAGSSAGLIGVRYARDLHINELKESNAVLVGAAHANPWVGLFATRCRHWIDWRPGQGFSLINKGSGDTGGKPTQPAAVSGQIAYAHVALKRNLGGRGHVLLVSGTGSQGTDGGIDFLLDAQGLGRTLAAAGGTSMLDEFEVLVRCHIRNGQNAGFDVIAAQVSVA